MQSVSFECATHIAVYFRSADDPFMTYSALYSGRDAIVVTKDELRDHRFLLGGPLANCFKRWQRTHQVVFLNVIKANDGSKVPLFRASSAFRHSRGSLASMSYRVMITLFFTLLTLFYEKNGAIFFSGKSI